MPSSENFNLKNLIRVAESALRNLGCNLQARLARLAMSDLSQGPCESTTAPFGWSPTGIAPSRRREPWLEQYFSVLGLRNTESTKALLQRTQNHGLRQIPRMSFSRLPVCDLIFNTQPLHIFGLRYLESPTPLLRSHFRQRTDYLFTGGLRHGDLIRRLLLCFTCRFISFFQSFSLFIFPASRGRACSKSGGKGWYP